MKKYLIILMLIPSLCFAGQGFKAQGVKMQGHPAVISDSVKDEIDVAVNEYFNVGDDASRQMAGTWFTSSSAYTVTKVKLKFGCNGRSVVAGLFTADAQVGSDSSSTTTISSDETWTEFTWSSGNPSLSNATSYVVAVKFADTSGVCGIKANTTTGENTSVSATAPISWSYANSVRPVFEVWGY